MAARHRRGHCSNCKAWRAGLVTHCLRQKLAGVSSWLRAGCAVVAVVLLGRLSAILEKSNMTADLPSMLDKSNMKAVDHLCGRLNFNIRYAAHRAIARWTDAQPGSLLPLRKPGPPPIGNGLSEAAAKGKLVHIHLRYKERENCVQVKMYIYCSSSYPLIATLCAMQKYPHVYYSSQ
jgi:hypothetical protein